MSGIFNTIFYQPILSVLVFIYDYAAFGDLGLAIILLTILSFWAIGVMIVLLMEA